MDYQRDFLNNLRKKIKNEENVCGGCQTAI